MNNVFLFDHSHNLMEMSLWAKALSSLGVKRDHLLGGNIPPRSHAAYGPGCVIFCHTTGRRGEWQQLVRDGIIRGDVVFVRSEGGEEAEQEERVHGCYWRPADFMPDTDNEAVAAFIDALRGGVLRPDLLQPTGVPQAVLAYALSVEYGLSVPAFSKLRVKADSAYRRVRDYALMRLAGKKDNVRSLNCNDPLPEVEHFESEPNLESEKGSTRFIAMRNLICVLREDQ